MLFLTLKADFCLHKMLLSPIPHTELNLLPHGNATYFLPSGFCSSTVLFSNLIPLSYCISNIEIQPSCSLRSLLSKINVTVLLNCISQDSSFRSSASSCSILPLRSIFQNRGAVTALVLYISPELKESKVTFSF